MGSASCWINWRFSSSLGLVAASVIMSATGSKMIKGSLGLIALAGAMKILASACKDFSKMSWEDIGKV